VKVTESRPMQFLTALLALVMASSPGLVAAQSQDAASQPDQQATQPAQNPAPNPSAPAATPQSDPSAIPDSPGATQTQHDSAAPQASTPTNGLPRPGQQTPPPQKPAGTAAAEPVNPSGVAASEPAGAAIAPAKQKRTRSLLIKLGAVVGVGAAVGTVLALSAATGSKPPGSH